MPWYKAQTILLERDYVEREALEDQRPQGEKKPGVTVSQLSPVPRLADYSPMREPKCNQQKCPANPLNLEK